MNLFENFPVRQRPNQMLPDSPSRTFIPRNWEIPIPRHLEEKVDRNWLTETFFEEKKLSWATFFASTKKNKPNSIFQFFGWSKCQLFWKCLPLPRVLSWWPVFGSSEHPIATSHKTTSKAGVPFWNGVGYQGGDRNPKGPCTPRMPRFPPLKYQGLICRPNSGTRRFFNNLLPGNSGVSIVGCWLLVVIAGCSCCWWWFCWLFFCCCQVASGRCSKTTRNLLRHLLVHPNLPRHKHTWTQVEGSYLASFGICVTEKIKTSCCQISNFVAQPSRKKTCKTTSGEDGRCFLHDSLVHFLLQFPWMILLKVRWHQMSQNNFLYIIYFKLQ